MNLPPALPACSPCRSWKALKAQMVHANEGAGAGLLLHSDQRLKVRGIEVAAQQLWQLRCIVLAALWQRCRQCNWSPSGMLAQAPPPAHLSPAG